MELTELRGKIDEVDRQLLTLLEERMDIAADIAAYKIERGLPVLDMGRETEKLKDIKNKCRPETADAIGGLFSDIMAASRDYQTSIMESRYVE